MCPSYMATGEEMHSTRGRARLLFEMQRGETLQGGWQEPAVFEAMGLCLSCKGCKGECPVNVDMATYRAEFLSHYYEGRARPLHVRGFAAIDRWARMASRMPGLVNLLTQSAPTAALIKKLGHIAPQRQLPRFAAQSFEDWFELRPPVNTDARRVLLWPDTFNNYLHPQVLRAAVRVLEHARWQVLLPPTGLCCGRPLYEAGLIDRAREYLQRIMDTLAEEIRDGVPIVGLEPACVSVFRDELPNLFPFSEQARRLCKQMMTLSEFLEKRCDDISYPQLARHALVHGHCHHKAVLKMDADHAVMRRIGLDADMLDAGCCGMAGSFGFDRDKYQVSMTCAERALLPRVRAAPAGSLVMADGFSCREQVAQATGQRPLHLAEVIAMGLRP